VAAVTKDELQSKLEDCKTRIDELNASTEGERFTEEQKDEYNRLNEEVDELNEHIMELDRREARVAELHGKPENVERVELPQFPRPGVARGDDIWDLSSVRRSYDDPEMERRELHDRARRATEMAIYPVERISKEDAQDHLARMLDLEADGDRHRRGWAQHVLFTGSPAYKRAFGKYVSNQPRTQNEEMLLQRAASLTTTAGGFAVPFVLDPSVIPTSSGAINPYRTVGNVISISVDEWRGVSSDGITAAFAAEAAVSTDAAATLAQPTVSTEKAFAFVPFSIEIGQDWAGFTSEMAAMFADAKDILEASKFAVGTGTNEPFGVITGATTVFTASNTNSLVVADIYGVHNALGPRFRRAASWTFNNAVTDRIRQLDTAGGANLWVPNLQLRSAAIPESFTDGRMGADLLGKPVYEATAQSGTFTTGQLIGVIGDYSYYKIVDRIGMTVETIPHIFGAAQGNLPTGQRGLYAYWRVGAKVLHANAFRTLKLA
jgi:HK97 family phage major capsid protein